MKRLVFASLFLISARAHADDVRVDLGFGSGFASGYLSDAQTHGPNRVEVGVDAGLLGFGAHAAVRHGVDVGRGQFLYGVGVQVTAWLTPEFAYRRPLGERAFLWVSAGVTTLLRTGDDDCICWFERRGFVLPAVTIGVGTAL